MTKEKLLSFIVDKFGTVTAFIQSCESNRAKIKTMIYTGTDDERMSVYLIAKETENIYNPKITWGERYAIRQASKDFESVKEMAEVIGVPYQRLAAVVRGDAVMRNENVIKVLEYITK